MQHKTKYIRWLLLIFIIAPVLYWAFLQAQLLLTRAAGVKANIIVDTSFTQGIIKPSWFSFSQGGEESKDMIAPVIDQSKLLTPRYIRLDHLYDHFSVVNRGGDGQLAFNFAGLDGAVKSILATGALPFFSLSYMPPAISSGDILAIPRDWNEWALVVQRTIEHYSGKSGMNLSNVYYEVWNEPDLFGGWKYSGPKNYLTLYTYSALGAQRAQGVNRFLIGGPATTQLYKNWIVALANHVTANNLRIDFFSWHRYTTDPNAYFKDISDVTGWLFYYPTLISLPRIISEWGFDSDINSGYDGNFAAAHTVATVRQIINGYEQLFAFEVVDGPGPDGKKYWGRWGLLTHPSAGVSQKPRFSAFQLLQKMSGQRLLVSGEGTWVSGFASKDGNRIALILANYDRYGRNTEQVPVSFSHLSEGNYLFTTTRLGQKPVAQTITTSNNSFITNTVMQASGVVLLELEPVVASSSAAF